jgi:UDP-3-O-[3-hydroxymyristoyl] N-acetylglucosamine deacetylase
MFRKTIANQISCSGIGGITGKNVTMTLKPATSGSGINFIRTDIGESIVPAHFSSVKDTKLNTVIGDASVAIHVVEHLMASLWSFNITDINIELDGPEVPLLDGSSHYFCFMITCAGIKSYHDENLKTLVIKKPIELYDSDSGSFIKCEESASDALIIDYTIDYSVNSIGYDNFVFNSEKMSFIEELSMARTFCTEHEIDYRLQFAKGWSIYNSVIYGDDKIQCSHSNRLRYKNEAIRHKVLDLIGDLMLSGYYISAKFKCYKSGHRLNFAMVKAIMSDKDNFIIA